MKVEYGFIFIKPPDFTRDVVLKIEEMIEDEGLEIDSFQAIKVSQDQAEQLYIDHLGKDFHPWLIAQMTSGPAGLYLLQGENAARRARDLAFRIRDCLMPEGEPKLARQELRATRNIVHTPNPDEPGAVQREGAIFFPAHFPL